MKKVLSAFLVVVFAFALCCCDKEKIQTDTLKGENLSDGTPTYYINQTNEKGEKIKSSHYKEDNTLISEFTYEYFYDTSGKITKIRETNTKDNTYTETQYDKFKNRIALTSFSKDKIIVNKEEFDAKENVKKTYKYKDGKVISYTLFDRYDNNQIKTACEYSPDGKSISYTTYTRDGRLAQIKSFDKGGMISSIKKNKYKDQTLISTTVFDGEFKKTEFWDYTKNPIECTLYNENQEAVKIHQYDKNGNIIQTFDADKKEEKVKGN